MLRCAGRYALRRRGAGILSGQWEFPNADGLLDEAAAGEWLKAHAIVPDGAVIRTAARHVFTHRVWDMRVYVVPCAAPAGPFTWLDISDTAPRSLRLPRLSPRCGMTGASADTKKM